MCYYRPHLQMQLLPTKEQIHFPFLSYLITLASTKQRLNLTFTTNYTVKKSCENICF